MKFIKAKNIKIQTNDVSNSEPLKVQNRNDAITHCDTDSCYLCINELKELFVKHGYKIDTEEQYRKFFSYAEQMIQDFFNKILEIRAEKSHTTNKIKFNRENIFTNMFCFAKKLYIGSVIDSEGALYSREKPKHKIMGVPLKRSDMPEFCKEAAEKLAFDVAAGQNYEKSIKFIKDTFKEFKNVDINELSSKKSVKEYTKYITEPIDYYLENGFNYKDIGGIFNAKVSLAYNYIIAKHKLKLQPITNGSKFNYCYVKPNNRNNIEAIAWIGKWPKEFSELFEIDYETMFRKAFIPVFESMFRVAKWIGDKEAIDFTDNNTLEDLFG